MIYVISMLFVLFVIQTFILTRQLADLRNSIQYFLDAREPLNQRTHEAPDESEEELTEYALEREEKANAYNERIQRLKNELAKERSSDGTIRLGFIAEELHPDVKNLPHNEIYANENAPDVEYAQ